MSTSPIRMVFAMKFMTARLTANRWLHKAGIAFGNIFLIPTIIADTSDIEIMRSFATPNKGLMLGIIPIYRHVFIIPIYIYFVKLSEAPARG